jgi:hypothetical protein
VRDEDHRRAVTSGDQHPLQIDPTEARHLHIGDQAGSSVDGARLKNSSAEANVAER